MNTLTLSPASCRRWASEDTLALKERVGMYRALLPGPSRQHMRSELFRMYRFREHFAVKADGGAQ